VRFFCGEDGWVDLDPTNNQMPGERHVWLAWGRDYEDVSPLKGVILGGGHHSVTVAVDVVPAVEPAADNLASLPTQRVHGIAGQFSHSTSVPPPRRIGDRTESGLLAQDQVEQHGERPADRVLESPLAPLMNIRCGTSGWALLANRSARMAAA